MTTPTGASIGLDVTPLAAPRTGIGRYVYELLAALWEIGLEDSVLPVGNAALPAARLPVRAGHGRGGDGLGGEDERGGDDGMVLGPRLRSRAAWTFAALPRWLSSARFGVFHGTSYYAPLTGAVPTVVTFHDMSVFACPEAHPRGRVLRARALLGPVARHASAVITPSRFSSLEAQRWLGVPPELIRVVPGAGAAAFGRRPDPATVRDVTTRHGLEPGFFLAVGTVEPRKNLVRVIDAFATLRDEGRPRRLVVAGRLGWGFEPVLEQVRRRHLEDAVRFVGYVPDDDLRALMAMATALVYPSLYEGFGLPILEAMSAGLPVITSSVGALEEVAGGAACLVDPCDVDAIAAAVHAVAEDDLLRARLRRTGLRRAAEFSWEQSARETLEVYRSVLASRGALA